MASWTQINISTIGRPRNPIKETGLKTDILFGVEDKGEHYMKREGDNDYLYPSELASKIDECKSKGGIVLEFTGVKGQFRVATKSLDGALNRLYEKIARIAGERRWAKTDQPNTILRGLERSIDGPFFSDYCLIAGLQCKYLNNGRLSAQGADKIAHAVSFGVSESEAKRDELTACLDGTKPPIRPRNMGWGRYEFDRLMYLIELESPIEVGVTLMGGTMTYNRIRLAGDNRDNSNVGGEWVTRQFLTLDEARSYKLIEENETTQGRDVVIAGIRGLPRVLEIDNALIRRVRQSYLESMGTEVCVQMYTIQHSSHTANSVYHDDYTDEPIMIVTLLKANGGGRDIRRHWKDSNRGTTGELKIGSITLQTFMEIKDIFMRPGPTTGRIFDID